MHRSTPTPFRAFPRPTCDATRHRRPPLAPAATALLAATVLAGCVAGAGTPPAAVGWVASSDERVTFAGGEQKAVRYDDGAEIEEYGRIAAGGWRGEYLYVSADGPDLALTASFDVARAA